MNFKMTNRRLADRTTVAPGVEIAYLVDDFSDGWSAAPTVIMLHGIAESAEAFNGWVPYLARHSRVIRPDLRGYGRSSAVGQHETLTIAQFADEIAALVKYLQLSRVHLIGSKLGAQIALELAQRQPAWLASMTLAGVLISPGVTLGKWVQQWIGLVDEQGVEGWARSTMPGRMGSALSAQATDWWAQYMGGAPADTVKACFRMLPRLEEPTRLEQIRCPSQVIVAVDPERPDASSQRQSVTEVQRWQSRIPGSTLVELQADSYHIAATHPDACAVITRTFIERIST